MVKPVIILGTGGNCLDILDALEETNRARGETYRPVGFLDDDPAAQGRDILGLPVLGPLDVAPQHEGCWFVNGIGSPGNFWRKEEIIGRTGLPLERFETIVHPTASVSRHARLGRGTVVLQQATVASQATVGHHVIILPAAVISHHAVVGDYTCIAAGACVSGGATVGRSCYLGTNCALIGHVRVGDCALVGMGSVVLRDVPANSVVAGNPARFLRNTR